MYKVYGTITLRSRNNTSFKINPESELNQPTCLNRAKNQKFSNYYIKYYYHLK